MTKRMLRIAATLLFGTVVALGVVQLSAAPAQAGSGSCVKACIMSGGGPAGCVRACR